MIPQQKKYSFYALQALNNIQISKMYVLSTFKEHEDWVFMYHATWENLERNELNRKYLLFSYVFHYIDISTSAYFNLLSEDY